MKIRLLLLLAVIFNLSVEAQDAESIKKQINNVKKSSAYIYGEANAESEEDAKGIAEEILYQEINEWAAKKKKLQGPNFVVNNKKELFTILALPRGDMFRAFVYVKKSDIVSSKGSAAAVQSSSATQEIISSVEPVNARSYPESVKTISSYTDYYKMADKIKELKTAGVISHYARYASLEKPEIYYLAIYNTEGKVVAVLTPGENRENVRTGQPDKITNYSGCGAIGFTVND